MVSEILLHVGMHKTGTTALQHALHGHDDGTVRHARLGHVNHSVPVVTAFTPEPARYHVWKAVDATPRHVAQERARSLALLDAEIALPRHRLTIVGEEISLLPATATRDMLGLLTRHGARLSVIAYLRDPLGYVTSAFQQQVRGGQACYTIPRPHYRLRFQKYLDLCPDAITFRRYAADAFEGGSVVADFARLAGLAPDAIADHRANPSLPLDAVRLIHLFNRTHPPMRDPADRSARSALIRLLATRFHTRFTLPAGVAALAVTAEELDWVQTVSNLSLGPAPMAVPQGQAEAGMQALLNDIPESAVDTLLAECATRRLHHAPQAGAANLLAILHAAFALNLRHAPAQAAAGA